MSHIGQIIHSTILDTVEKVKAVYGENTEWIQLSGYVLRGATSGVTPNNNAKDLGSDTHTITEAEMPSHRHSVSRAQLAESAGSHAHGLVTNHGSIAANWCVNLVYETKQSGASTESAGAHTHYVSAHNTNYTGSGTAMSIIPNEKNVYIWERVG